MTEVDRATRCIVSYAVVWARTGEALQETVERAMPALHQAHLDWGKQRLGDDLAKANGWVPLVSPNTIKRILRNVGLWPAPVSAEKGGAGA